MFLMSSSAPYGSPFLVEAGNRYQIRPVHFLDEATRPPDHAVDVGQALGVDRGCALEVDGRSHAPDQEVGVRVLAPEDRVEADHVTLPVQRFQIVSDPQQIDLGR